MLINQTSPQTIINIDCESPPIAAPRPSSPDGVQMVQLAEDLRLSEAIPNIKLIGFAAATVLDHPLAFEDVEGAEGAEGTLIAGYDPKTGLSIPEEIQRLGNSGTTIAFVQINKNQFFAKVDGRSILSEGTEKFYKALLAAVRQCSSDIVTEEEARSLRFSIADFLQKNADALAQKWSSEILRPWGKQEHTIINMPGCEDIDSGASTHATEENAWATKFSRPISNVGVVLMRNLISVGTSTAAREYVRHSALPTLFKNLPNASRLTAGGVAAALPVALQLIGIARDIRAGTQTPQSLSARLANILAVGVTGVTLTATGGLSAAANALIAAIFVYVPLRDLIQYFLLLRDNNESSIQASPTMLSAVAYTGNQIVVDQGMAALVKALEPSMGPVVANVVGRTLLNIGGETLDELTNRGLHAWASNNSELEISSVFRSRDQITSETALDQVLNTLTARASLFSTSFSMAYLAPAQSAINSMVVGATLGAGYLPFAYGHAQKKVGQDPHPGNGNLPDT